MIAAVEVLPGVWESQDRDAPYCGDAFCDRCGNCLDCFGGGPCRDGSDVYPQHLWVIPFHQEGGDPTPD